MFTETKFKNWNECFIVRLRLQQREKVEDHYFVLCLFDDLQRILEIRGNQEEERKKKSFRF